PIPVDLDREVRDHVAQLRAALIEAGESFGEAADRRMPSVTADCRAVERAVRGEAIDDCIDIAAIERRRVAHEQILDRHPVFQRTERHWLTSSYTNNRSPARAGTDLGNNSISWVPAFAGTAVYNLGASSRSSYSIGMK